MVEHTEYKGKPILILKKNEDDKFPFSFGMGKAKLIMANYEAIKKFVEEQKE